MLPETLPCPICNAAAQHFGEADFNKSCEDARGKFLPATGVMIQYYMCPECRFCYAPEFAQWSPDDFATHIYNSSYIDVDPDFLEARPAGNADFLIQQFESKKTLIRHLDYGGGSGKLSSLLQAQGWDSTTYDPFVTPDVSMDTLGKFNMLTAYEVFEHAADTDILMRNLSALLADDGIILFSTLLSDENLKDDGSLQWWYAAPRNGHISLFSSQSLKKLGAKYGFQLASFNHNQHMYFRYPLPRWLNFS